MLKWRNGNSDDIGRLIYCGRAIAIVSVVIAHSAYGKGDCAWYVRLVSSFASAGVAFFFFASGLYWKRCTWTVLSEKLLRMGVPWLTLGSLTWIISCLGANAFSLGSWVSWILGNGTYLWYLTVFSVILILFHLMGAAKKWILVLMCILTLLSRSVTAIAQISGSSAFLNPMNWIGFFAFGVLAGKAGIRKIVYSGAYWRWMIAAGLCILLGAGVEAVVDARMDYWSYLNVFVQCAWVVVILAAARVLSRFIEGGMGKNSLFLYLSHMPVIGFLSNRLALGTTGNVVLSMVTAIALYGVAMLCCSMLAPTPKLLKLFGCVSGIHVRRGDKI